MKKKFATLLISAIGIATLAGCSLSPNDPGSGGGELPEGTYAEFDFRGEGQLENDYFAIENLYVSLKPGQTKKISSRSLPNNYAPSNVNFVSNDPNIATVDETGKITAVSKGIVDIDVLAKDGSFSNKVRVSVSDSVSGEAKNTVLNNLNAIYAAEDYKAPTKVYRSEYSIETYSKEGVVQHGNESVEAMGYNSETGYFFVEGPSVTYKTANGAPEVSDGKWIMYPINSGLKTRLVHITPTAKNYLDINTAKYKSYDRIIRDIINFFFVNGEEILTNLLKDYEGKEDLESFPGYSSTKFLSPSSNAIVFDYSETGEDHVVDYKDELEHFDIPADTVYDYDYAQKQLIDNGRTKGIDIQMEFRYQLDGANWTRNFNRSQTFEADFEEVKIQNPKDNGFKQVDNIYDL